MPGEIVVRYRDGHSSVVRVQEGAAGAAVAAYERRPDVDYAEPNYRYRAAVTTPDDPLFGDLWGLNNTGQDVAGVTGTADADIDAVEAWALSTGSGDVAVAVVDTGVDLDHPDLSGSIWTNPGENGDGKESNRVDDDGNGLVDDWRGWDWVDGDNAPRDLNGHGTHVAGTIAARGNDASGVAGVTWSSSIMALRVLDSTGFGTNDDISAAFRYAAASGARIVNASLAGSDFSLSMADAIAASPATLFIVAAGNEHANDDVATTPAYPCNYTAANLICVAATDQRDLLASFSNYGPRSVDLAAPGVTILSAQPPLEIPFSEDFETDLAGRWISGGIGDEWARAAERPASGSWGLTDSPDAAYANGSDSWVRTVSPANLSGGQWCRLEYSLQLALQNGPDRLIVEASRDGALWDQVASWTGTGAAFMSDDLSAFDSGGEVYVRFRLSTDSWGTGDGAHIDDVAMRCLEVSYSGNEFAYYNGTSMAAPHVSGVAALVLARRPGASVYEMRNRILCGSEAKVGLADRTVSGGRLNALRALSSPSCIAISVAGAVTYGAAATLSGKLSNVNGGGIGGKTLSVQQRPHGAMSFAALGTVATRADGTWSAAVKPARRTEYRVTFAGSAPLLSSTSPLQTVLVRPAVSLSIADQTIRRGGSASVSGRVSPAHPGRRVRLERQSGGTWVLVKSMTISASGLWSGAWTPPASGTYRLRARLLAPDADHAEALSPVRTLSVS